MDTPNGFAERLREGAKKQGIFNPNQLASRLGVAPSGPNGWWKGTRPPTLAYVQKLVELLRVDANWLLTGEGASATPAPAAEPSMPSDYLHTRMSLIDGQSTLTEWQRVLARDVEVAAILADAIREAERAATIRAGALRAAEDAAGERARAATAAEEAARERARASAREADKRFDEAMVALPKEPAKRRRTG